MSTAKPTEKATDKTPAVSVLQQQGWIDKQDIMQNLHVSERTLQKWRSIGLLPFYRVSGKIYYKSSEVVDMIESYRCTGGNQRILPSVLACYCPTSIWLWYL